MHQEIVSVMPEHRHLFHVALGDNGEHWKQPIHMKTISMQALMTEKEHDAPCTTTTHAHATRYWLSCKRILRWAHIRDYAERADHGLDLTIKPLLYDHECKGELTTPLCAGNIKYLDTVFLSIPLMEFHVEVPEEMEKHMHNPHVLKTFLVKFSRSCS